LKNSVVIFDGLGKISQKPQKCPGKKFGGRDTKKRTASIKLRRFFISNKMNSFDDKPIKT
jgi:hypothetical protein